MHLEACVINEATVADRIHRARDRYLATLERQTRALAELPTDLEPVARLVAVDTILSECAQALDTLAEQLPSHEQASALGPELIARGLAGDDPDAQSAAACGRVSG